MKSRSGKDKYQSNRVDSPRHGITRRDLVASSARITLAAPFILSARTPAMAQRATPGTPRKGGTLIQVISADPNSSNPNITTSVPDTTLGSLVYEGVTTIDEDFRAVPCLAESWEVTPDGLRYTFKLVDAKWQDGKPFTSADVKYTLEEVSARHGARFKAASDLITNIGTPDARTVVIELSKPYGPLLFSLSAYAGAAVLPGHLLKGTNVLENPASLDKPVGTGPFILKEWRRGDRLVLDRNPNYWQAGKPYLDQIVLKIIPDGGTRVLALKAGEVDYSYFYFYPPSRIKEALTDTKLQLREQAVPQDKVLIFNLRRKPFDNVKVREAVLRATNREYIKKVIYHDLGNVPRNHIDSRLTWAHDPNIDLSKMYAFSIDAAKKVLDEAGFKPDSRGKRMEVKLAFDSTDTDFGRMSQVLASMWGHAGVQLVFEGAPRNVMMDKVFAEWDFDVTLQAYSTAGDPALGVARLYISSAIQKRPFLNVSGYSNPEVDALFEAGANEADFKARGEAYKKAAPILARDLPVIPIWETASINVASVRVKGKWAWSTGYSHWEDVWLEQ
jgi:peptide/nickel transport system substrate-binding protein